MTTYTIAQAKDQFSKLVDETLSGGHVTITRHGRPVVHLIPAQSEPKGMSRTAVEAMIARAKQRPLQGTKSGADIVRAMRDEEPDA